MKCRGWPVLLALILPACGDEPAARQQERLAPAAAAPAAPAPSREVAGPELRGRGLNVRVTNSGVSGDTSAAGRQRIGFVLDGMAAPPDLAIVELGGNDLLRGIPPAETRDNLAAILAELQRREIPVLLMGMRAPPNLGAGYVREFDGLYGELAAQYRAALVPFFLEAVWDRPALIQPDRIHPTADGIETLVAATADDVVTALPDEGE